LLPLVMFYSSSYCYGHRRDLHSFPTRRSSDLNQALTPDRIIGVETGGCPHTAIREDASMNLAAVAELNNRFENLDVIFIESGGRSEEHTSELQSRENLVCRLLLEKKKHNSVHE